MKLLARFLNILFVVPSVFLTVTFVVKDNAVNDPIETQKSEKTGGLEPCMNQV